MIEVNDLAFTYTGAGDPALTGLNFRVAPGEIFGFLGPSGAGKSTTQKILIKLLQGYQGRVTVMGRELNSWRADYFEKVGVSFETPNHYLKMTALENLTYFRSLYAGPTLEPGDLLEQVNLGPDADQRVAGYSKGMKMRLNFVRALLHQPELIFLDEPTAGLDPVNAKVIKEMILQQKAAGKTIFLTTHDMTVADQLCDRVAFIVEGEIKLIDAPKALKIERGRREVVLEYGRNGQAQQAIFPLADLGHNEQFLALLRSQPLQTMHTQEPTLEQIFIDVTGRRLL
ncbi:MAG: ABC transporter ATP-binding protein [Anaerolineae bacterium]|nr:ABC transporter ATP-binding protein [Anaerolineae bacterium]